MSPGAADPGAYEVNGRGSWPSPSEDGDWPHTTRILPWLLAAFLVMIFLIPFDSAQLPVQLPFDLKLDRIYLVPVAICWLVAALAASKASPRFRRSPLNVAVLFFAGLAVTSVLINIDTLANVNDASLSLKKLALLFSMVAFFFIFSTVIRPREVPNYVKFMIGLAVVTAIGLVIENRTGTNNFFNLTDKLIPGVSVDPRASSAYFDATGRRGITGPTSHGLAATTMLSMVLPFAIVGIMRARERRERLVYAAATLLILTGALATVRKSAGIVPFIPPVVLLAYRPRAMLRLLPYGLVMMALVHPVIPGAMGSIKSQLFPKGGLSNSPSVEGRTQDYDAIRPDLLSHLALGRGYGSFDPQKYRLLDNEYLSLRVEVGYLGMVAYLLIILAVFLAAHRLIRSRDPERAAPALGAVGAAAALGVASALYDSLAFPQVPYLLLFIGALVIAASEQPVAETAPARLRVVPPPVSPRPAAPGPAPSDPIPA